MRPAVKIPFNADLVASFIARQGLKILPAGTAVRENDNETWHQQNARSYAVRIERMSAR